MKELKEFLKDKSIIKYRMWDEVYMRIRPKKVLNPKTIKQNNNRLPFGFRSKFASKNLRTLIDPYWNPVHNNRAKSGFNLFMSVNKPAFVQGQLSYKDFILIPENGLNQVVFDGHREKNCHMLSWDLAIGDNRALPNDELYLIILTGQFHLDIRRLNVFRKDKTVKLDLDFSNGQHYYVFWKREGRWSESKYLFSGTA